MFAVCCLFRACPSVVLLFGALDSRDFLFCVAPRGQQSTRVFRAQRVRPFGLQDKRRDPLAVKKFCRCWYRRHIGGFDRRRSDVSPPEVASPVSLARCAPCDALRLWPLQSSRFEPLSSNPRCEGLVHSPAMSVDPSTEGAETHTAPEAAGIGGLRSELSSQRSCRTTTWAVSERSTSSQRSSQGENGVGLPRPAAANVPKQSDAKGGHKLFVGMVPFSSGELPRHHLPRLSSLPPTPTCPLTRSSSRP